MSRRYQQRYIAPYNEANQYQATHAYPIPHAYKQPPNNGHHHHHHGYHHPRPSRQKPYYAEPPPLEGADADGRYETVPEQHFGDSRLAEYAFSDGSDQSSRVPSLRYYEEITAAARRQSGYNVSESASEPRTNFGRDDRLSIYQNIDSRKRYPIQGSVCETCYDVERGDVNTIAVSLPKRGPVERPQSSEGSSGAASAVIHACGGRCQTCENVCYYFLQVAFVMGILIGISLSIAGSVLRKPAARNLQVLIYIGSLCAAVCFLLLCIQCRSKRNSKRRKTNPNRSPIPLEPMVPPATPSRQLQQQVPLIVDQQFGQNVVPRMHDPNELIEEPGIPWWRRRDIESR